MKIEMGESLALSWLRHVKKCSIVQANWKPSFEWEERDDWFVEQVLQEAHEYFEEHGFPVLPYEKGRHTVDAYNVLMQTECDGIGVKVGRGTSGNEYFAIESAFHADGLYDGKTPNAAATKVAEKMVRIVLALYYFMGVTKAHVYFAAPKITKDFFEPVRTAFDLVSAFFRRPVFVEKGMAFDFELLLNAPADAEGSAEFGNRFNDRILRPVKRLLPIIDDTAELFVRALGMDEICTAHCDVSRSNLRCALKSLGIKFEEFLRRCETFRGVEQMLNDLDDEGGSRAQAILDYVSNMKMYQRRKFNKLDIERRARAEERWAVGVIAPAIKRVDKLR